MVSFVTSLPAVLDRVSSLVIGPQGCWEHVFQPLEVTGPLNQPILPFPQSVPAVAGGGSA